jgi:hypothetical protein
MKSVHYPYKKQFAHKGDAMKQIYRLVLRSGPNAGQVTILQQPEIIIGRDLTNPIVVSDVEVSRRHARMTLQGNNYVLEDLGSTNGTFVNGERLVGPYVLHGGEIIGTGEKTSFLYEVIVQDPDATVMGAAAIPVNRTAATPPTPPAASIQQPVPPPAAVVQPPASYAGQVPQQPPAPKKKFPIWIVLLAIGAIVLCCIITFVIIDAANLYCDLLPWFFNALTPGSCP